MEYNRNRRNSRNRTDWRNKNEGFLRSLPRTENRPGTRSRSKMSTAVRAFSLQCNSTEYHSQRTENRVASSRPRQEQPQRVILGSKTGTDCSRERSDTPACPHQLPRRPVVAAPALGNRLPSCRGTDATPPQMRIVEQCTSTSGTPSSRTD